MHLSLDELIRSHKVRVHPRARHVLLRVTDDQGLVITVPPRFDRRRLPAIIEEKRPWIRRTHEEMVEQRRRMGFDPAGVLPRLLHLRAIDQVWTIETEPSSAPGVQLIRLPGRHTVRLSGSVDDKHLYREVLRRWVRSVAQVRLVRWLERVSTEIALPFSKATVRSQKSRWGSCSTGGRISLNCKLLFVPPRLVRYLFVHELVHTRHMNHSRRYWTRVESIEPACTRLDKQLKDAWAYVPPWF